MFNSVTNEQKPPTKEEIIEHIKSQLNVIKQSVNISLSLSDSTDTNENKELQSIVDNVIKCFNNSLEKYSFCHSWDLQKTQNIQKIFQKLMSADKFIALLDKSSSDHKRIKKEFFNLHTLMVTNDEWVEIKYHIFTSFVNLLGVGLAVSLCGSFMNLDFLLMSAFISNPASALGVISFFVACIMAVAVITFIVPNIVKLINFWKSLNPFKNQVLFINQDKIFLNTHINTASELLKNSSIRATASKF